ncbi:MAG: NADH:flavin oxidoreductase/NADH oxidase, partial [Klenkia sp.]|nr:NADH:flavin oxidoreductase/NADH oxidase [Klenkia sp.]
VGVGVAELLAAAGRDVALATPDDVVGSMLGPSGDLAAANGRLARAGVRRETAVLLRSWADGVAVLEHRWSGAALEVVCAAVVDAGHRLPGRVLPDEGRERFAGDVVAPRTVLDAVLEGRRAAHAVSARVAVTA